MDTVVFAVVVLLVSNLHARWLERRAVRQLEAAQPRGLPEWTGGDSEAEAVHEFRRRRELWEWNHPDRAQLDKIEYHALLGRLVQAARPERNPFLGKPRPLD